MAIIYIFKPRGDGVAFTAPEFETVQSSTNSGSFVTLLDITGGGRLYWLNLEGDGGNGEVKLTIDGYVETDVITATVCFIRMESLASTAGFWERGSSRNAYYFMAYFQDNLKIEYRKTTAVNLYAKAVYGVG